jgi:hypothetical protein
MYPITFFIEIEMRKLIFLIYALNRKKTKERLLVYVKQTGHEKPTDSGSPHVKNNPSSFTRVRC